MSIRDPFSGRGGRGGRGGGPASVSLLGPVRRLPRDLLALLLTLFATWAMQFFAATEAVPAVLRLTPFVWRRGFVWQLLTYPFVGAGGPSGWFLLELLILYWFSRDVYAVLGRRRFWRMLLTVAVIAGVVALAFHLLPAPTASRPVGSDLAALAAGGDREAGRAGGEGAESPLLPTAGFPLLQGQGVLMAICVAAFATAFPNAIIRLFFVLPIEARWFLLLDILFAFIGYLQTRDGGGFVALCASIGLTYVYVRDGGLGRGLRQTRLRAERWWLQRQLARSRRRSGMRIVKDSADNPRGPWTH